MSTGGNLDAKLLKPATGAKKLVAGGGEGSGEGGRGEMGGRRKPADVAKAEYWVLPDSDDEEMPKWSARKGAAGRGRHMIPVTDQVTASVIMAPTLSRMVSGMDWQRKVDNAATQKAAVVAHLGDKIIMQPGGTLEEAIKIDDDGDDEVGVLQDFTVTPLMARNFPGDAVDVGLLTAETIGLLADVDPAEPQGEAQKDEVQTRI